MAEIEALSCKTEQEIEEARVRFLGKKGLVTALFEEFRTVAPELKREYGQKLNVLKNAAAAKIEALKEALKGEDMDAIKAKQGELQQKVYAASEKLYKAAAEQAQAAQGAEQANADPNVYDAEFTEDNGDNQ